MQRHETLKKHRGMTCWGTDLTKKSCRLVRDGLVWEEERPKTKGTIVTVPMTDDGG